MNEPTEAADSTDLAALILASRLAGTDVFDLRLGLRLVRTGHLMAANLGTSSTASVDQLVDSATAETVAAAGRALRFLSDLERQDLDTLLRAITIALGDLPGNDGSAAASDPTT